MASNQDSRYSRVSAGEEEAAAGKTNLEKTRQTEEQDNVENCLVRYQSLLILQQLQEKLSSEAVEERDDIHSLIEADLPPEDTNGLGDMGPTLTPPQTPKDNDAGYSKPTDFPHRALSLKNFEAFNDFSIKKSAIDSSKGLSKRSQSSKNIRKSCLPDPEMIPPRTVDNSDSNDAKSTSISSPNGFMRMSHSRPVTAKHIKIIESIRERAHSLLDAREMPAQDEELAGKHQKRKQRLPVVSENVESKQKDERGVIFHPRSNHLHMTSRPVVPHDFSITPSAHHQRCQHFPPGTVRSHLAKSARCRGTTFGSTNRIAFLEALARAYTAEEVRCAAAGVKLRQNGSQPEVGCCDAKGLTQCGSPFDGGRLLGVCCTFGNQRKTCGGGGNVVSVIAASAVKESEVPKVPYDQNQKVLDTFVKKLHVPLQFGELINAGRPMESFSKQPKLPIYDVATVAANVNTRYSANKEWFHSTAGDVQAQPGSHFHVTEKARFNHDPWFDDEQKQRKEKYKEKLRIHIRDKNDGSTMHEFLRASQ
ncbi:hypothetical protein HDU83_001198 [Entophlyctis luteolus]|nr:hypothetical protein HDU83_001198 [Entophlyctis luteolus]